MPIVAPSPAAPTWCPELFELGSKVESVKKIDPTRPHPSVPNEPGMRTALGPVAALFDRMRDAASGRGNYE